MPLQEIQHPAIDVDLRYASADNFTGQRIYDHAVAFLHKDALDALHRAGRVDACARAGVCVCWMLIGPRRRNGACGLLCRTRGL
jgi:D-alanyl-D-alanine dipeptidase